MAVENCDESKPLKEFDTEYDSGDSGNAVSSNEKVGLKRHLGLVKLIAFLVGSIIGSGIFASPSGVAKYAGSTGCILLVWIVCGIIAILGAFTWCELALMFPNACGSDYTYIYEAFGNFPAFVAIYLNLLTGAPGLAILGIVAGNYVMTAIDGGEGDSIYVKLIASGIIVINMLLHCFSIKWGPRSQVFFTGAKTIPIAILVVTGLVRLGQGHTENFIDAFNGSSPSVSDIGYSLYGGLFAYDGWGVINYLSAETIDPIKLTPIAIMIGIPFVIVCYLMTNIAYLTVMSPLELAASNAVAVTIGNNLYGVMSWTIPLMVGMSCFGTANATTFLVGRQLFEAANKNHLPKIFATVHIKRHTPIPAIMLNSILALITLIPESTNFMNLLKFLSFVQWAKIAVTIAALLWLRKSRPLMKRPFKVFIGVPILLFICAIFIVFAPFYSYPLKSSIGLALILPAIPLYLAFIKYQILPDKIVDKIDTLTKIIENFGNLSVPEDHKNDDVELV